LDAEHLEAKPKMGLDAEEGLTENDIGSYMENGIGGKVVELEAVEI
jgi:hypothetical protein